MALIRIDPSRFKSAELQPALDWLRQGGVVAFPTDTLYGLAVDPTSAAAVEKLFAVKGRHARAAVPLIASSTQQVEAWCRKLSPAEARLADRFWPGPLSLILEAPSSVAEPVHAGANSIAIRVPAHTVARVLCELHGRPLTATSANRSGAPAVQEAEDLDGVGDDSRVFTIDAGSTPGGLPSTIVDARGPQLLLVRAGAIAWERVLESLNG